MSAFPNYYRASPAIDRIVWKSYPTVRTAWAAMMRGEVDFLYEVGPEARRIYAAETSVESFHFFAITCLALFSTSTQADFPIARVRRGPELRRRPSRRFRAGLKGHGIAAADPPGRSTGRMTPPFRPITTTHASGCACSMLQATPALRAMRPDRPPSRIRFHLPCSGKFRAVGADGASSFSEISPRSASTCSSRRVPFDEFNQRIAAGDFDAVLMEFVVGQQREPPFTFWHSQSKQNIWGYSNPGMDAALWTEFGAQPMTDATTGMPFDDFQLEAR